MSILRQGPYNTIIRRSLLFSFLTVVVCSSFGFSCGKNDVDEVELIGKYSVSINDGKDFLELKSDGKYIHTRTSNGDALILHSSDWSFNQSHQEIRFSDFEGADELFGMDSSTVGILTLPVKKTKSRQIRIIINDDLSYFYEKER